MASNLLPQHEDICVNVTYDHRIDDPDHYNFCIVPDAGYDAVLFVAVAIIISTAASAKLSALFVLVSGAVCEVLAYYFNLGRFGNSIALWLGMQPSEIFFYVFLPPLLLDSAVRMDFFIFKKVMVLSLVFAFAIVITSTFLSIPAMLYIVGLSKQGWSWVHAALFSAMVASTDAVAVSANLKSGGAPELLSALLEGESLFNDASGLVLFDIFLKKLKIMEHRERNNRNALADDVYNGSLDKHTSHPPPAGGGGGDGGWSIDWNLVATELMQLGKDFAWLAGGGAVMGLLFGYITTLFLRWLQWRRMKPHVEVTVTFGMAYLCFYIANAYLQASGVMAVVVFGLYGAANMTWDMSLQAKREGWMQKFWDVLTFGTNGIIFFYVGASSTNYIIRLSDSLNHQKYGNLVQDVLVTLPMIYLLFTLLRGVLIAISVPFMKLSGADIHLPWQGIVFCTMGGLRGAVSLILAQAVLTYEAEEDTERSIEERTVAAQMGLFTSGFVLLTLCVNGPLITPLMSFLGLNGTSETKLQVRRRTRRALLKYTETAIAELKQQQQESAAMLRGVDWTAVATYVDLTKTIERALPEVQNKNLFSSHPTAPKPHLEPIIEPTPSALKHSSAMDRNVRAGIFGSVDRNAKGGTFGSTIAGTTDRNVRGGAFGAKEKASFNALNKGSFEGKSMDSLEGKSKGSFEGKSRGSFEGKSRGSFEGPGKSSSTSNRRGGGFDGGDPLKQPLLYAIQVDEGEDEEMPEPSLNAGTKGMTPFGSAAHLSNLDDEGSHRGALEKRHSTTTLMATGGIAVLGPSSSGPASLLTDDVAFSFGQGQRSASAKTLTPYTPPSQMDEKNWQFWHQGGALTWTPPEDGGRPSGTITPEPSFLEQPDTTASTRYDPTKMSVDGHDVPADTQQAPSQLRRSGDSTSSRPSYEHAPASPRHHHLTHPHHHHQHHAHGHHKASNSQVSISSSDQQTMTSMRIRAMAIEKQFADMHDEDDLGYGDCYFSTARGKHATLPPGSPHASVASDQSFRKGVDGDNDISTPRGSFDGSLIPGNTLDPNQLESALGNSLGAGYTISRAAEIISGGLSRSNESRGSASTSEVPLGGSSPPKVTLGFKEPALAGEVKAAQSSRDDRLDLPRSSLTSAVSPAKPKEPNAAAPDQATHLNRKNSMTRSMSVTRILGALTPFAEAENEGMDSETEGAGGEGDEKSPPITRQLSLRGEKSMTKMAKAKASRKLGRSKTRIDPMMVVGAKAAYKAACPVLSQAPEMRARVSRHLSIDAQRQDSLGSEPLSSLRGDTSMLSSGSFMFKKLAQPAPKPVRTLGTMSAIGASFKTHEGDREETRNLKRDSVTLEESTILEGNEDESSSQPSSDTTTPSEQVAMNEATEEYRVRLISGLKRAFHSRHQEGLLSGKGLRILDFCCDSALDEPGEKLDIWRRVEKEINSRGVVQLQAWMHLRCRQMMMRMIKERWWLRSFVKPMLAYIIERCSKSLSAAMMVGMEVALELWQALTTCPHAQWLDYAAGDAGATLRDELDEQADLAWHYITDREIEAPDRFQAIQTHRAAMAILRQQQAFVTQLLSSGMIDEMEADALSCPIERRMWKLERRGPKWKQPSLTEVLMNVPFMQGIHPSVLEWFKANGELVNYPKGFLIGTDKSRPGGLFIVISGMVRITLASQGPDTEPETFYMGTGGVGGLTSAMMNGRMPGMAHRSAYAEGNALGKGPIVFHLSQSVIYNLRDMAVEDPHMRSLELKMYRLAGIYVLDRQRHDTLASLVEMLMNTIRTAESKMPAGRRSRLRQMVENASGGRGGLGRTASMRNNQMRHAIMESAFENDEEDDADEDGHTSSDMGGESSTDEDEDYMAFEGKRRPSYMGCSWSSRSGTTHSRGAFHLCPTVEERLARRCLDISLRIFNAMRDGFKSARLVHLQPGQTIVQLSTILLVRGSLIQLDPSILHPFGAFENFDVDVGESDEDEHGQQEIYSPPSLLMWLPDYFDYGISRYFRKAENLEYVAGKKGATLLVSETLSDIASDLNARSQVKTLPVQPGEGGKSQSPKMSRMPTMDHDRSLSRDLPLSQPGTATSSASQGHANRRPSFGASEIQPSQAARPPRQSKAHALAPAAPSVASSGSGMLGGLGRTPSMQRAPSMRRSASTRWQSQNH